jgi:hypothetical protein
MNSYFDYLIFTNWRHHRRHHVNPKDIKGLVRPIFDLWDLSRWITEIESRVITSYDKRSRVVQRYLNCIELVDSSLSLLCGISSSRLKPDSFLQTASTHNFLASCCPWEIFKVSAQCATGWSYPCCSRDSQQMHRLCTPRESFSTSYWHEQID